MRHYTIKTVKDCVTFKCPLCKYSVTTLEFDSQNGSRRTQAARVMNEHASAEHRALPMTASNAQIWPIR